MARPSLVLAMVTPDRRMWVFTSMVTTAKDVYPSALAALLAGAAWMLFDVAHFEWMGAPWLRQTALVVPRWSESAETIGPAGFDPSLLVLEVVPRWCRT